MPVSTLPTGPVPIPPILYTSWRGSLRGLSVEESHATGLALLPLHVPSLVPGHVLGGLDHVVSMPTGDRDEGNSGGIVADLLDEVADLLGDLLKPGL